jgi:hypothetical protein
MLSIADALRQEGMHQDEYLLLTGRLLMGVLYKNINYLVMCA